MKKLITAAVASAFAFLAIGAINAVELPSGTSVESYTGALQTTKNDSGSGDDSTYWFLQGDENAELLVTNYVVTPYQPRPEQFTGDNNNYLKIDTTGRLYRSIGVNGQDVEQFPTVDIGDGIYLDTLVQFTAADEAFSTNSVAPGDKIAIEYVEHEGDETTGEAGYTNFVVRAGYVAGSAVVATNYFLTFPGQPANEVQFDKTAWHRLTVRAISNVSKVENANAPVGFAVYVDGTNLVYKASVSDGSTAAGDEAYVGSLNSVVTTYLYNDETHALLPSLLRKGETGFNTLSAVAFNGNGCVDDISFTNDKPDILPGEGTAVTIEWDANVANYTVRAGETTIVDNEAVSGAGSTNLLLATGITTLTVTATYATGYEAGTWTVTGSGAEISGSTFTVAPGAKLNIVSMYPYFQVGDAFYEEFDGEDGALAAAIAGSGVIKLNADYPHDIALTEGSITIDLAGKTITGDNTAAIVNAGADLIITNSTVAIGHIVNPDEGYAILIGSGTTSIYGGWIDGQIEFDTEETFADLLFLYGGYYVDVYDATTTDAFYLNAYKKDDVSYVGDPAYYFQVGSDIPEPPAPATYAISWTLTGGTTEATAGDFEENDTIVFTADTGKTLSYVEIDGVEDTSAYGASSYTYTVGTADAELVVTFTTPATPTYAISWTLTGGTTTATSGDDFEENDTIVFTADSGKTLSFVSIDGVEDSSEYGASSYTYTVGTADAVLVVTFTGSSGYDSGDGEHTFVIPTAKEDLLEGALPTGKTLADTVPGSSTLTYAQAYALGLWDENAKEVAPLNATIAVGADGKVTVALANQPADGFLVTCKVYEKTSLTAEWPTEAKATYAYGSETPLVPGSASAGFYKVAVVIANALD